MTGTFPAQGRRPAWGTPTVNEGDAPATRSGAERLPAFAGLFPTVPEDSQPSATALLHGGRPPAEGSGAADLSSMFDDADEIPVLDPSLPVPVDSGPDLSDVFAVERPPEATVNPFTGRAEPVGAAAGGRFSLADSRAMAEAARVTTAADLAAARALQGSSRYADADRFVPVVEQILALGAQGGSPELQALIRRMTLTRDPDVDREQRADYESAIEPLMEARNVRIGNPRDRQTIFDIAYDELLGIGPLGPLWRDDEISEIMVSGPDRVSVERAGHLELTDVRFRSLAHLEEAARNLAALSGDDRAVSSTSPVPTLHLDGARVQFVWRPLAVNGVVIVIRKFGKLSGMSDLLTFGSLTDDMADLLSDLVTARANILVSGGTGAGKTTFLNALSGFIPSTERVITIEDALELNLRNLHVEPLVTKEAASADDTVAFDQAVLLKTTLRLRPDRIVVGEVREGKGCSVMLEAANTGHDGTMTTLHANNATSALRRMAQLLRRAEPMPIDVARAEVLSAINVVVQVVKRRGRRFVAEISVAGAVDDDTLEAVPIFIGELGPGDREPTFRRVGGIGPDTELSNRMLDAGLDPTRWE